MATPRIFTLEEAEATLPLVGRIAGDLAAEFDGWRAAVGDYEVLAAAATSEGGEGAELRTARERVTEHARRVSGLLQEIDALGCVFKGFEEGLVDFYTLRDDRLVFLCWRLGEPRIGHWHEVHSGFAGRRPVDDRILTGTAR
ncbi:MAG TPA: DUF2203 domain-containing protein [Gemmatimonadales bacterium]|nr:DUF2203 domain-containing protein [Gemmatimonadales bacterium]